MKNCGAGRLAMADRTSVTIDYMIEVIGVEDKSE